MPLGLHAAPEVELGGPAAPPGDISQDYSADSPADPSCGVDEDLEITPVHRAINEMLRSIIGSVRVQFMKNLSCLGEKGFAGVDIRVGSMYSGSDMPMLMLEKIATSFNVMHGIDLRFLHVFSAECNVKKREWIQSQAGPNFLFRDCDELGESTAHDTLRDEAVDVPGCDWLISGFPCPTKSRLNPNRSKDRDCIREGTKKTGIGFQELGALMCSTLVARVELTRA